MSSIDDLRKKLDEIDHSILDALARRRKAVEEVVRLKDQDADFVRDLDREENLLADRLDRGRRLGLDGWFVTRIFREILENSLRMQKDFLLASRNPDQSGEIISVGYQGTEGAYSHEAARKHFGSRGAEVLYRGYDSFRELLEAAESGECDYAVQPIENTTAGSINEAYDLLNRMPLFIVGEEVIPIEHCLVGLADVPLARIRRIFSHPQALAQCSEFLAGLSHCKVESHADTAMAVAMVRDAGDESLAAIASDDAARHYGLSVLRRDVANQRENFTRFVIVAKEVIDHDVRIPCKTSLILATGHKEGALMNCLNVLHHHKLNMTKLESRPRLNVPWEYYFYIDFEGNASDKNVQQALHDLTAEVSYLKVLGSYPALTTESARPASPKKRSKGEKTTVSAPAPKPGKVHSIELAEKKGYKLASRAYRSDDSIVRVGEVAIGGDDVVIMAGPCSVESEEQIRICGEAVQKHGGHILRGGVFKPRTSTYSFQGLGFEGLDLLVETGRNNGLPVVTEVMHPADVGRVAQLADMIQIGARNMQNFSLLREVGRIDRPVLLKRGAMASIDEFLAASEYLLAAGNQQVVLCERGIRTFETATRFTLDLSAVPVLRERTHLPVIVDPSHAAGAWQYITSLSLAALAAGAHGIMVEIHPEPAKALSDGPQALTFDRFAELMKMIERT